ncbi:MAG: ribosome biogenesis GTPase Der [Candidatus Zixiibacteriota bacterium]
MSLPVVAIVGRPNVGKSSLFNRFLRKKLAVVDAQAGITRDRNYATCDWNGVSFLLVDTGGMVPGTKDMMEKLILDQTDFAINESDLVLLMVDAQVGIDTSDQQIARSLVKAKKTCLLVANKVDTEDYSAGSYEFVKLGMGEPWQVSASEGRGIGDLMDELVARLPVPEAKSEAEIGVIRVAVVGRPNVGKSSFINKLLGQERLIVSPIAGTTRDSVDTPIEVDGQKFVLIDTAGLRRRYKVAESIEFYTTLRTARAIENCDVGVVIVDAAAGITTQDQRILAEVLENRRAAVVAVNKWDLIEKDAKTADKFTAELKEILAQHEFVPIMYISAISGQRVAKVLSLVREVHAEHNRRVGTAELNEFLQRTVGRRKPPARQGKHIQFKYLTQTDTAPPTFMFFTNHPKLVDKTYIQYLTNQLREQFGFEGVPIRLRFRSK